MLLLLLLKIKGNVTLLSQVRHNYPQRVLAWRIRMYYGDNNGAGRVALSMCSDIRTTDDLTRSDIFVRPLNM